MEEKLTNQKETDRAIKAAVDQFKKYENHHDSSNRGIDHIYS